MEARNNMIINGKEVQTRYGMLATDYFLSNAKLLTGLGFYSTVGLVHIIWGGVMNWYEVKQLPYPVTFEEVYDFVEESLLKNEGEQIQAEVKKFEESQSLKTKVEQVKESVEEVAEIKKKMIQTSESESDLKQD